MKIPNVIICLSALILVVQAGCGSKFPLSPVTGTVTYQGNPVPQATVVFQPEGGPPATATTDAEGRFTMNTSGSVGVMPGNALVMITALEPLDHELNAANVDPDFGTEDPAAFESSLTAADIEKMARRRSLIPAKYGHPQTSGLTAQVKPGERNDFPFDLVD